MKSRNYFVTILFALAAIGIISCEKLLPGAPKGNELLDGPVAGLSTADLMRFSEGDFAFNSEVFTASNGLGPVFVATSCGSCHAGDGKGHPSTTLTRFGQSDSNGNQYMHLGGPQLQHRALPGYTPEQIPSGAPFSKFTPPANTGLGFLELVSDADLLLMADPNDADGDGISGVPNWRPLASYLIPQAGNISKNGKYIHRFGKKAAAFNLLHQTVNAYNQDIGITSVFEPFDAYSGLKTDAEVSTQTVNNVVFYLQTLKAPQRRKTNDPVVQKGETIFLQTGCEACHKQTLKTAFSAVEALSNKVFHPYTDLLLHDMGPGLDDGYTEGSAKTAEWRTPPLWGLGLSPNSQGGEYFLLHDGRAKTIDEAIRYHGGEGTASVNKYNTLSPQDRDALLTFLKSL